MSSPPIQKPGLEISLGGHPRLLNKEIDTPKVLTLAERYQTGLSPNHYRKIVNSDRLGIYVSLI
jgi:hypothetical protein